MQTNISEKGATIQITQSELDALIQKAAQKAVNAKVGSMSVKGKVKELPKLDISQPGALEKAMEAAGHKLTTTFLLADYKPVSHSEKSDKQVGGYAFIESTEPTGFRQPKAVWIKTAGVSGQIDLDGVVDAKTKIRAKIEVFKQATEALEDYEKGLEALFNQMVENEPKD